MENDNVIEMKTGRSYGRILAKTAALAAIVGAGFVVVNRVLDKSNDPS